MSRHRYSWASQGSEQSDEIEPDWPEIRFPVKIARNPGDRTDYSLYEFSAEVTTPDGGLDLGDVRLRGGSLFVRFQPYDAGLHKVQVLADGVDFCPALFFDVSEDGSHRRLKSSPRSGLSASPRRQKASRPPARTYSQRSQRSMASQGSDDEDTGIVRRGRAVQRSSSRTSAASSLSGLGLNRRGSFRQSDDSLERFAAASARYSVASSYDDGGSRSASRPSSAGHGRRRSVSSLSRHSSNASRQSYNRDAFSDSDLGPVALAQENVIAKRKKMHSGKTIRSVTRRREQSRSPGPEDRRARSRSKGRAQSPVPSKRMPRQPSTSSVAQGGEVLVSPTGDMFLLSGGQAVNLRVMGRSPTGDQLAQSPTGQMYLVKDGKAVALQRGLSGSFSTETDLDGKKKKMDSDATR